MKLLLHIGTEKTGSSFLQKTCAHNRDFLTRNGIWFPRAGKHEARLMHAHISSGNAFELSKKVADGDWDEVRAWITTKLREASTRGCHATLLSNEILCAVLGSGDSVSRLNVAAREAGASEIKVLLLIRDPVDQALSLYKHRAKNGQIGDISDWVRSDFNLPAQIESLLSQMDQEAIDFIIKKYTKDGTALKRVFFSDWLGLLDLPSTPIEVVNPSLTLSELQFLSCIAGSRPESVPLFYAELLAIPAADKASDAALESAASEALSRHLCLFESTWQELAGRLQGEGGLHLPKLSGNNLRETPLYAFAKAQLEAVARAHGKSLSPQTQFRTWIQQRFRRPIGRLWSKLRSSV